ncbi:MAG: hypothetical protein WA603_03125, partial [Candidatus Acidiferrales bacterium]
AVVQKLGLVSAVTLKPDGTIKLLLEYNIPITRECYLDLAFAGNPPEELDPEIAEELIDLRISRILPDAKWTQ